MTDARDARDTTRELDDARAKYRGKIIPKPALRVMDAETARLAASRLASRALKAGDSAPDFILPDAQGNPWPLLSVARGTCGGGFLSRWMVPVLQPPFAGFQTPSAQIRELGAAGRGDLSTVAGQSLSTQEKNELTFLVLSDVGNKLPQFGGVSS